MGWWEVRRGREKGYLGGREGTVERWVVACLLEGQLKNSQSCYSQALLFSIVSQDCYHFSLKHCSHSLVKPSGALNILYRKGLDSKIKISLLLLSFLILISEVSFW